jgi:hypothetical protein
VTGVPRVVWLASYPKSGNTWVRSVWTALAGPRSLFSINRLDGGPQPCSVDGARSDLGLDPRWLDPRALALLRAGLVRQSTLDDPDGPPLLRKTHERYEPERLGAPPFPTDATRAAIHVVRDPRDVVCSWAHFFGTSLDDAVDLVCQPDLVWRGDPITAATDQPLGSWAQHVGSWSTQGPPFPVHPVRYEDLVVDPVAVLGPVLDAVGLARRPGELEAAVASVRFERLAAAEGREGFRERSSRAQRFFRRGRAGGWRDELPAPLAARLETELAEAMSLWGYTPAG